MANSHFPHLELFRNFIRITSSEPHDLTSEGSHFIRFKQSESTYAMSLEKLFTDPDFRATIEGDSAATVLQALKDVDERGVFFHTLGTEQYSGKSYLSGGELPVGLSEEVLDAGKVAHKKLKSMKKVDMPRHFLSANLVNDETKAKMKSADKFVDER